MPRMLVLWALVVGCSVDAAELDAGDRLATSSCGRLGAMLPDTRDETVTDASPVTPALINRIQDCIINGSHGLREFTVSPHGGITSNLTQVGQYLRSTGVATFTKDLGLVPGDEVDRVEVQVYGEAPNTADITTNALFLVEADMSVGAIASTPENDVPLGWHLLTLTPASPYLLLAGEKVYMSMGINATGVYIGTISVWKRRP